LGKKSSSARGTNVYGTLKREGDRKPTRRKRRLSPGEEKWKEVDCRRKGKKKTGRSGGTHIKKGGSERKAAITAVKQIRRPLEGAGAFPGERCLKEKIPFDSWFWGINWGSEKNCLGGRHSEKKKKSVSVKWGKP